MQSFFNKTSNTNLSKLLIYTKYGGIPFLNDYLVSLFEGLESFNVIFPELLMNLDCFARFHREKIENNPEENSRLLSKFFNLKTTYLTFNDFNDDNSENGINAEQYFIVNSSTGKSKVSIQEFVTDLDILNPDMAVIPFEFIPKDSGNKRIFRSTTKMIEFLKLYESYIEKNKEKKTQELILPIHINFLNKINIEDFDNYNNLIDAYLIICDNYHDFNLTKIVETKKFLDKKLPYNKPRIKFGNGHPIEMMIAREIGCEYLEVSYPFIISEKGLCISSNYEKNKIDDDSVENENINLNASDYLHFDLKKIDLSDKSYELDNRLIKENCKCFTCTKGYSRAYIHHLIKCNELNGKILIIMHNLYFVCEFYKNYFWINEYEKRLKYFTKFIQNECDVKKPEEIVEDKKKLKKDGLNKSKKERFEDE